MAGMGHMDLEGCMGVDTAMGVDTEADTPTDTPGRAVTVVVMGVLDTATVVSVALNSSVRQVGIFPHHLLYLPLCLQLDYLRRTLVLTHKV